MPAPDYVPQLATLVKAAPEGDEWLHEIKYDGYRIGCRVRRGRVTLLSRTGKEWTSAFPEIATAVREIASSDLLLDGEVVMLLPDGRTSFQALQNAADASDDGGRARLVYFAFDLLRADGASLASVALEQRKARLQRLLAGAGKNGRLRYSDHVIGHGARFFDQACRAGLEGIISKRRDQPYRPGRSDAWLKTKCVRRQEFVIGGYTDPEGARVGIGALLVGYYDDRQRLVFSGKVGTGFTRAGALDLRQRLERLRQPESPFHISADARLARNARWVAPRLACEVAFTEWTSDGRIRHPSFQGLRHDKPARDTRREQPDPNLVQGVRITHADRVVYPDAGLTKADVARYYDAIASWIVPHVRGRPLTLVRCPDGVGHTCYYMKHSKVWAPAPLRRVRIQEKTKLGEYLIADDAAGVVGLVQMGVLEIHTWNSDDAALERPNRIVFDLDPGDDVRWEAVIDAARLLRHSLQAIGLASFVKTTGGSGLHVVVPLVPHAEWTVCLAFSRAFAGAVVATDPGLYTTGFARSGRSRKILIDYLRNNRTNTTVAAYSTRAKPRAPVSVPLTWKELGPGLDPAAFTVATLPKRLARLRSDPWHQYWASTQKLTRPILRAVGVRE